MLVIVQNMDLVVQILSKIKICTTDFSCILKRTITIIYPKIQMTLRPLVCNPTDGHKKGVTTAKSFSIVQISRFATLGFYADNHTSTVMGTLVPVPYRFAYSSLVAL